MTDILGQSTANFCRWLESHGLSRAFFGWDGHALVSSAPVIESLAEQVARTADFDRHEGMFLQIAPETRVLQAAFVHRTCRGQGQGGTRYWNYDSIGRFLSDGLRLSRGMTLKNALAGIWWGGGKGVIARGTGADPSDPAVRRRVYEEYGSFVSSLNGCYVTAEDVGTRPADMAAIHSRTRFVTCIPPDCGGSGNPSPATAKGVLRGMEAGLHHLAMGTLEGKRVVVQGLGQVGQHLVHELLHAGVSEVIAADIDPQRHSDLRERFPGTEIDFRLVERGDNAILFEQADVIAPCATGAVLNPETIPSIRAPLVCGAANNQLADFDRDSDLLMQHDITYLPDFLVNRMGIVQCADEQYGYVEDDAHTEKHLGREWDNSVFNLSLRVLARSKETGHSPDRVAREIAEDRSLKEHPVWGHRGIKIIEGLRKKPVWAPSPA